MASQVKARIFWKSKSCILRINCARKIAGLWIERGSLVKTFLQSVYFPSELGGHSTPAPSADMFYLNIYSFVTLSLIYVCWTITVRQILSFFHMFQSDLFSLCLMNKRHISLSLSGCVWVCGYLCVKKWTAL